MKNIFYAISILSLSLVATLNVQAMEEESIKDFLSCQDSIARSISEMFNVEYTGSVTFEYLVPITDRDDTRGFYFIKSSASKSKAPKKISTNDPIKPITSTII